MAWTYDTDLSTGKDTIRLLIGDTISTIPLLTDEEIAAVLTGEADGVYPAAAVLCRSLSARFGREASLYTDVIREEKIKQAEHFRKLAEEYEDKTGSMTEFSYLGGVDSDGNDTGPFFTRQMQLTGTDVRRELNNQ